MDSMPSLFAIYEQIMDGNSRSLTAQEMNNILYNLANGWNHTSTTCESTEFSKDAILLIFSIMTTSSMRHMWPDEAGNTIGDLTNFNILRNFLDNEDMLISYSCSRAIAEIFKNVLHLSCVEYHLDMELTRLCQDNTVSAIGLIHRLDLMSDVISRSTLTSDDSHTPNNLKLSVCQIIVRHWQELLSVVFSENSSLQQHVKYSNILYSMCCLWNKIYKCLLQNSSDDTSSARTNILTAFLGKNEVLLCQMRSSAVPLLCRSKCLSILLHSVPYRSYDTGMDTNADCYLNAARNYLTMMMTGVTNATSSSASMNRWVFEFLNFEDKSSIHVAKCTQGVQLNSANKTNMEKQVSLDVTVYYPEAVSCAVDVNKQSINLLAEVAKRSCTTYELEGGFLCDFGLRRQADKVLQKFVLLSLRSLAVMVQAATTQDDIRPIVAMLTAVGTLIEDVSEKPGSSVADLFCDQDNYLFEALLCSLDVYSRCAKEYSDVRLSHYSNADSLKVFEPHLLFLKLLEAVCWDHMVLLDFVSSPETCSLIYFTRYLQYVLSDWSKLGAACRNIIGRSVDSLNSSLGHSQCLNDPLNRAPSRKRAFSAVSNCCDAQCWSHLVFDNKKKCAVSQSTGVRLCAVGDEDSYSVERCCAPTDVNETSSNQYDIDSLVFAVPRAFPSVALVDYSSSSSVSSPEKDDVAEDCSGLDFSESESVSTDSVDCYSEESLLDKTMSTLIRFRMAIERLVESKLFPYNVRPLIKLLSRCEHLYDET